jgi:ubiquinone/menaquinone biosynthesis C-methylase UbiE
MLPRILEPELMDSDNDAREYDTMNHSVVNAQFVSDLLRTVMDFSRPPLRKFLDLGSGTAQIPIALARLAPHAHIIALDAAQSMLALARQNISVAGLAHRVMLLLGDAKQLPFDAGAFEAVISNSIFHHIPEPRDVLSEILRVTVPSGLLFHRDLCRPASEAELNRIVDAYAGDANAYQRKLFTDSLHAALAVEEMQRLVAEFGFAPETVRMTSDRHWTWIASKI